MTDTNSAAATQTEAKKVEPKTVNDDMVQRRTFSVHSDAAAYIGKLAGELVDFDPDKIPFITHGFSVADDGTITFDSDVYPTGYDVMVAKLSEKGSKEAKGKATAIVITPIPSLDTLLTTDGGKLWVQKIIEKELNLVAVRPVRNKADMVARVDEMPTTAAEFIAGGREGASGAMEAFEALFKRIKDNMGKQFAIWNKANLPKAELKKAFSSASYARDYYPALENRGEGKDSLFFIALKVGKLTAAKEGLDPAIFDKWLASRDSFDIETANDEAEGEEESEMDADAIAALMMADDKPAAPAADAQAQA